MTMRAVPSEGCVALFCREGVERLDNDSDSSVLSSDKPSLAALLKPLRLIAMESSTCKLALDQF